MPRKPKFNIIKWRLRWGILSYGRTRISIIHGSSTLADVVVFGGSNTFPLTLLSYL